MKKIALIFSLAFMVVSCDKAKETIANATEAVKGEETIDYLLFTKESESKKWYDTVVEKMGSENAKVCDEVRFSLSRPSMEGMIKRQGDSDKLSVDVIYQDPADKRQVEEIRYYSSRGWDAPVKREIQVMGSSSAKENFKLENELFNFSEVTFDIFNKVLQDAWAKYKNEEKYEYQYINYIKITKSGISVDVKGKLKSNAQEKTEYYKTNLKGVFKK